MSFLEDDGATLAEALAFLDDFCVPESPVVLSQPQRKPRVRDPTVYARRRERKKRELQSLRDLARSLERQLRSSRRSLPASPGASSLTDSEGSSGDEKTSKWLSLARSELRRRVESEKSNLQLRTALAAQIKLARVLQDAMGELSTSGNVVVDASLLARANDSVYSAVNVASITAELRATTERLFLEVTSMKDDPMAADAVVSESSIKVDPVVGKYAENRGAAPLGKSFDIVLSMMMNEFWHLKFPATSSVILDGEPDVREKRHDQDVKVGGADVRFHSIGVLAKRVVDDSMIVTYANLLFHPTGNLCFRVGGWFVLKKSPENDKLSIFRSCSRLAPDVCGDASAVDKTSLEHMQSGAMAALGAASKRKHLSVQRRLLVDTGREDLAMLLPLDDGSFAVPVKAA